MAKLPFGEPVEMLSLLEGMLMKCERTKGPEDAQKCYEEILKQKPKAGIAQYKKGECLEALKKYDEAIECFEKASVIDPDRWEPHRKKGDCLYRMDKFEDAIRSYQIAAKLGPRDISSLYMIAYCYIYLLDEKKAAEYLGKAAEIDPDKAREYLKDMIDVLYYQDKNIPQSQKDQIKLKMEEAMKALDKLKESISKKGKPKGK